jgi:hypothetical protein
MSRRARRHTCRGKRRFHDHEEAVRALHRISGPNATHQGHNGEKPKAAYPCMRCKGWHLSRNTAGDW